MTDGNAVLATSDTPRASVIILAWKQARLLRRCLLSLSENLGDAVPFEVIILLNGADEEVCVVARSTVGARVFTFDTNLGFGSGCNRAASLARGEYLVLLNDDTEVEPGWLETLVETADRHPLAGAVGSRILFSDGTLQEAGQVIWDDGTTACVGRGQPEASGAYGYLRRVDYCSASSLLVRKSAWDAIGGMDEEYFPAYYEDVDFCLSLQGLGQHVLYEPRSRVRHYEAASTEESFRSFLFRRNVMRFRAKWAAQLALREPANPTSRAAVERAVFRARGCPRRLLIVDDKLPDASVGSGFGRMSEAIDELADKGYAISIYSTAGEVEGPGFGRLGVEILSGALADHLRRPEILYDVVILSRPHNFELHAHCVRALQPQAVLVYDAEALFWRRLERQAMLAREPAEARRLSEEADRHRSLERRISWDADYIVCVSEEEKRFFEEIPNHCPVEVIDPIALTIRPTQNGFADRSGMVFVAGWLAGPDSPNVDGLLWFRDSVLPLVRDQVPWARLSVTGSNPPDPIREVSGPCLELLGHVADLRHLYDRGCLAIAPVRYGAGVKIKVLEALTYGVPVVTTSVGAEGMKRELPALNVADRPEDFAAAVVSLLTDPSEWERQRRKIFDLHELWLSHPRPSWAEILDRAQSRRLHDQVWG